ncbi:MAG TPA: MFS transporter [Kineosporiaceae bacterium]
MTSPAPNADEIAGGRTGVAAGTGRSGSLPGAGGLTHHQVLVILTGLMLGMFLAALDQTIVASAIRTIGDDLHGLSVQAWVTTAYLITSTISTPLYGKLSDIFGRRPLFLTAIGIFVVGSAACAFATSMYTLAGFRAFQGLGAGGLFSLALAIIGDIVPPRERAKYQGYFLAVFGTSSVLGPVIGGFFAGTDEILWISGWRWVFLVNVPVGIVALVVVTRTLRIPHVRHDHRIDYLGAVLLVVGLVPLLTVLEQGRGWGWDSPRAIACYAIAGAGLLAFVGAEHRAGPDALIPLAFFRNRMFTLVSIVGLITGVGMFGGLSVLPLYLQIVRGATPTQSGLMLLPLTAGIMLGSVVSGQLISRTGHYKIFPIIGTALMVVGMYLLHTVGADTPFWRTEIFTAVFGLGLGNVMQPITLAVQNAMAPRDIGVATSSVTFFRQMGATIGTAVFLSILFSTVGENIRTAFSAATRTPGFQAAVRDPAVQAGPSDQPILGLLKHGGGSVSSSMIDDTSFLNQADKRLAEPFFVGFSQSMDQVFLVGACVLVVGFLVLFLMKEIPLRTRSGLEARQTEAGAADGGGDAPAADAGQRPQVPQPPVAPAAAPVEPLVPVEPRAPMARAAAPPPPDDGRVAVSGRVVAPDGEPVAEAVLTLTDLDGRQADRGRSAADGWYRLVPPSGGSYLLICAAAAYQPVASIVVLGRVGVRRDLTLAAAGSIAGVVVGAGNGTPVAQVTVTVTDVRGEVVAATVTASDGTYRVEDLDAGDYTLTASSSGHRPTTRTLSLGTGVSSRLDLRLVAGGEVTGVVRVAASGRGHPAATVTLVDGEGAVVGTVQTDTDGGFRLPDLTPGRYTLIASGYGPVARRVEVRGGPAESVDLLLGPPPAARRRPAASSAGGPADGGARVDDRLEPDLTPDLGPKPGERMT